MEITRIDPPCWFAGLKSKEFSLLIYGNGLENAKVLTDIPYSEIKYSGTDKHLFVTLILCDFVEEGYYDITIVSSQSSVRLQYEFKQHRVWKTIEPTISNKDVVYLVMPDRFAKGNQNTKNPDVDILNPNAWHGGNITGMIDSLDYLEEVGITALWHTPIFKSSAYHGYAIEDFYAIDCHFGNFEIYKTFVEQAHNRGIKVVMDVVFNHCSIKHPWVKTPPTKEWFNDTGKKKKCITNYKTTTVFDPHAANVDLEQTVNGWFTEEMPDLNLKSDEVLSYMIQMTKWWIETTGIDAIRMDTYLYSDLDAMIKWQNELSKEYPYFSVLAETWVPDTAYTSKIQREVCSQLTKDSSFIVMDFAFQKKMEQYLRRNTVYDKEASLYHYFVNDFLFSDLQNVLVFLDNHDLSRWFDSVKNKAKLKQALGILLTVPRIPQIYYGTEFMITNDGKGKGDGDYRVDTFELIKEQDESGILNFIKKLLCWRKTSKPIAYGSMKHFIPQNGIYVYFRIYEDEKVMVISNGLSKSSILDLGHYREELSGYEYGIDVETGKKFCLESDLSLRMKRNEIKILNLFRK
jgi:glycosidase